MSEWILSLSLSVGEVLLFVFLSARVYLFYMFCSCRQLFFTRYVCVFKSQWFQLYLLVTFCHFEMFISLLSTLSCCESNRTCDKNTDFSSHFSNYKYLIAIYNSLSFGPLKWREKKTNEWRKKKEIGRNSFRNAIKSVGHFIRLRLDPCTLYGY